MNNWQNACYNLQIYSHHYSWILTCLIIWLLPIDCALAKEHNQLIHYIDHLLEKTIPTCDEKRDFPCIQSNFEKAFQKLKQEKAWIDYADLLTWHNYYAIAYNELGKAYAGLLELEKTLDQHQAKFGTEYGPYWVDCQLRMGGYLYELGEWTTALPKYQKAEQYYARLGTKTTEDLDNMGILYRNLGGIYQRLGEYNVAYQYYLKSLRHEQIAGDPSEKTKDIALTYKRLGDLYATQKNYTASINHYSKARNLYLSTDTSKLRHRNGLVVSTLGLASVYRDLSDLKQCITYLQEAARCDRWPNGMDYDVSMELGLAYQQNQQFPLAKRYFQQSLDRRLVVFGPKGSKTAEGYIALGSVAAKQQQYKEALSFYDSAIECLNGQSKSKPALSLAAMSKTQTFGSRELLKVLSLRSTAYLQLHFQTRQKSTLQSAWQNINEAIAVVDLLRNNPRIEKDKFSLSKEAYPVYEQALEIAMILGPGYRKKAFEIAEKSKSVVLLDALKASKAAAFGTVPSSLILQERQIANEIALTEDSLLAAGKATQRQQLEVRLFGLHRDYRDLLENMAQKYPRYHRMRYGTEVLSAKKAQRKLLHQNEALLEYFVGERNIYVFMLSKRQVTARQVPVQFPLQQWVQEYLQGLTQYHLNANSNAALYQSAARDYTRVAHALYQKLWAGLKFELPSKVIIIPDGLLCYLPFEALLSAPVSNPTAFATHPYLIHQHSLSYAYSATFLGEMRGVKAKNRDFLGLAPNFQLQKANFIDAAQIPDSLYYNEKEVNEISKVFNKHQVFYRDQASKQNFIQNAAQFGVIHIATHALASPSTIPQIMFSGLKSNRQVEKITTRDLYQLNLNAEMIVLSACATGYGDLQAGEGLISLARGFAYAGSKSIVCTLWPVNDRSTSSIMLDFYTVLTRGATKSDALHTAKLNYLTRQKEDFTAHPFFWSAYIPIGNMQAIFPTSDRIKWGIGLLLLAFVFWFFQNRKPG